MDYEKKYNEALERAKKVKHDIENIGCSMAPDMLEVIFPELAESEDERIRRAIYDFFSPAGKAYELCGIPKANLLAWLEKQKESLHIPETCKENADSFTDEQKEQKQASTEDMPYITDEHFFEREPADSFRYKLAEYMTKNCRKEESTEYGHTYHISAETILKMAEEELLKRGVVQKPAEWGEEDEKMRLEAIRVLVSGCERYRKESGCLPGWHKVISWLKSLRERFNSKKCNKEMDLDTKLQDRLEEISRNGLENAHTIDFSKEYENSKQILEKGANHKERSTEFEEAVYEILAETVKRQGLDSDFYRESCDRLLKLAKTCISLRTTQETDINQ